MSESTIAFFVVIGLLVAITGFAVWSQWRSSQVLHTIASEQHALLMSFHSAGQGLAAHQLEMARIAVREREAEVAMIEAKTADARTQAELAARADRKFPGRSQVVDEV